MEPWSAPLGARSSPHLNRFHLLKYPGVCMCTYNDARYWSLVDRLLPVTSFDAAGAPERRARRAELRHLTSVDCAQGMRRRLVERA